MNINPIVLSIPIYFVLIGIELIYDLYSNRKLYRLGDAIGNISCGITEQVTGVFVKVATVAVYHFFYTHFSMFDVPHTWIMAIVLFVGVDFFYYWAHRFSHEINLFWLGHVVHHQSEDYNLSVALRQGSLQKLFTAFFYVPLALFGFETEWFVYVGAFTTLYQFWIHTEAIDKLPKWFEYIFNTPSHHRVHHGRNPKYIDKNHGGTFIIFDRWFGTFQAEEEKPTYGVTTPINTFNAISAHIKPIQSLAKDWNAVSGFKNKLKLLFMPPGWLPKENGGMRFPPEITYLNDQKFIKTYSNKVSWYVLFQYTILLAGVAFFLFNYKHFSGLAAAGVASMILFHILVIGQVLDQSLWANKLEYFRLLTLGFVAVSFLDFGQHQLIIASSLIFITLNAMWFSWIYSPQQTATI
tara:strand:+ start:16 stop:1242 length:1227 start_codon:yes stop_codon:yes gene_type:complete